MSKYNYNTDSDLIQSLYKLLYDVHNILLEHNIPYYITGGTLIGAVRHKGIIPWDNDIDIACDEHDIKTIVSTRFRKMLKAIGYKVQNTMRSSGWIRIKKSNDTHISMDIFPIKMIKGVYHFFDNRPRSEWKNDYYRPNDLFPLKEYKFGKLYVLGPKNPDPTLSRLYGKDWKRIGYITQDPRTHFLLEKPIKLSVGQFKPAKKFFTPPKSHPITRVRKDCPLLCAWNCAK